MLEGSDQPWMQQSSTKQRATKCLQNQVPQGLHEVGPENLCRGDLSQHSEKAMKVPTERWKDLDQAPKTRDCIFPTSQVLHTVTTCGLPVCWPSRAFPCWYPGTVALSTCLWLRGKKFQRTAFLQGKRAHGVTERWCVSGFAANICTLALPRGSLPLSEQSPVARQSCNAIKHKIT